MEEGASMANSSRRAGIRSIYRWTTSDSTVEQGNKRSHPGYGLFLCFFSSFTKFQSKAKFRKMTQLHGKYLVDLDETGIHYIAPSGESRMEWKVWGSFAEGTSSFVLVQRGSTMFMPIPKRELSTSQIDELRTLLAAHLPRN
jgi:hypothetical protein